MTIISPSLSKTTPRATQESEREDLAGHVFSITAVLAGVIAAAFLVTYAFQTSWQYLVIGAGALALTIFCLFLQNRTVFFANHERRVIAYNLATHTALTLFSLLISDVSPIIGGLILFHTILISSSMLVKRTNLAIIIGLLFAAGSAALGVTAFLPRILIGSPLPAHIIITSIAGIIFVISLSILTLRFISTTLGMKLIAVSLLIAIIPLVVISAIQSGFTSGALRDQTNQALELAANQTATKVDDFIQSNRLLIQKEAELPVFVTYVNLPPSMRPNSPEQRQLRLTLESIVAQGDLYLSSYGVINIAGINIYDSNPLEIGKSEKETEYFIQTVRTRQVYASPVLFTENNDPYIYFAAPIRNSQQQIVGILRARYDALILQSLLKDTTSLIGSRSYPVLLDDNYFRIADTLSPNHLYKSLTPLPAETIDSLISQSRLPANSLTAYSTDLPDYKNMVENYETQKFFSTQAIPEDTTHLMFGTVVALSGQPWKIVYFKEQSALVNLLTNQRNTSLLIAIIMASAVAFLSTLFGTTLSRPIIQLKSTADRISTGDLSAAALIQTKDEIGSLGNAFNLMTQRLRESIYELEDRVQARTAELATQNLALQYRSQQLLTVSDVARQIATAKELDILLDEVTQLISERFNFYHVGIFLLDEKNEYAVLRASNSEGGKRMLARQHKLKVGQIGMVGFVTGSGTPRTSTDVGQDAVYFNNPDLPLTRSEMTLPLMVSDRIIGALDVQSVKSDAFEEEDIKLFSTLADQVAIAIQNNEFFQQTTIALEEAQSLHRQYLNQEWQRETSRRSHSGYVFSAAGLAPFTGELEAEVERALNTGETVLASDQPENAPGTSRMVMPIMLRGEPIGVIHLQQSDQPDRDWSENEVATVQAVADQVAQALENARLFEQTVRRAERERKALDITSKIRATNDPQAMLEIAVKELQQALGTSRAQIYIQSQTQPGHETKTPSHKNNGDNGSSSREEN